MIVIVGSPVLGLPATPAAAETAEGSSARIALAAVAAGADVQLVGKVGDDAAGESVLLALGRGKVGHLATMRVAATTPAVAPEAGDEDDADDDKALAALLVDAGDEAGDDEWAPAPPPRGLPLEPADIALGLQYLVSFRVLVAAEQFDDEAARVIADAASFAGAQLVAIAAPGARVPEAFGEATVLERPDEDPAGEFAALVGWFAAALDRGVEPARALAEAATAGGWRQAR